MKTKDLALTANSNLLRSKVRTSLTIIAIFVGAFTLSVTSALGAGISAYIDSQLGNLGQEDTLIVSPKQDQGAPGEPQKYNEDQETVKGSSGSAEAVLTKQDIEKLKALPGVKEVEPFVFASPDFVTGPNNAKYTLTFSNVNEDTQVELAAGELMASDGKSAEIILPEAYVKTLGFESADAAIGEEITLTVSDVQKNKYEVKAVVAGVLAKGLLGASGAIANESLRSQVYEYQSKGLPAASKDIYTAAIVKADTSEKAKVDALKKKIEDEDYSAFTIEDQLGVVKTVIKAITYVLNGFALIALLAAGFGIVNTLLMSVQERTREIGLMKAMGMSSKRIFALFSLEAALIGFWGSAFGVGLGMVAGYSLNNVLGNGLLKDLPGLDLFLFTPQNVLFVFALITGLALLSGTLPARRAAKLNPIDALRYE